MLQWIILKVYYFSMYISLTLEYVCMAYVCMPGKRVYESAILIHIVKLTSVGVVSIVSLSIAV